MKSKIGATLFIAAILAGCSQSNGVSVEDPRNTADFFNDELDINNELVETTAEYYDGIKDVIEIDEDTIVVLNDEDSVEQVHFNNRNKEEVMQILDLIEFPTDSDSIEQALSITPVVATVDNNNYFTNYEGTGVFIDIALPSYVEDEDRPYSLLLLYNEDRFDDFKKMTN